MGRLSETSPMDQDNIMCLYIYRCTQIVMLLLYTILCIFIDVADRNVTLICYISIRLYVYTILIYTYNQ